ncbi:MAG: hypothetical protein WAT88_15130 [Saprospiraceae bacterium]
MLRETMGNRQWAMGNNQWTMDIPKLREAMGNRPPETSGGNRQ